MDAVKAFVGIDAISAFSRVSQGWSVVGIRFGIGLAIIAAGTVLYLRIESRKFRGLDLANVDAMTGPEFERFVAALLRHKGYQTRLTPASGDLGVDIVAHKDGVSYAIQCKRRARDISRTAISDAVAGMAHYRCDHAMVVTNRGFTSGAALLSRSTKCLLIGRKELAQWIAATPNMRS